MAGKTLILITGANQGLGYYAAQQLAATGKYHVLIGSRDIKKGIKAIETLAEDSSVKVDKADLEPLQIDVTSDDSINAAAAEVEKKHGKLDILLNNAGIAQAQAATEDATLREMYHRHFDTNLFGAAVTTEAFLPLLRKGSKRLAFTSSSLSSLTWANDEIDRNHTAANYPLYRSTKTALSMIMLYYTKTLQDEGFVVSAADPGYCATNLNYYNGMKDPREGAKALIRAVEGSKEDVHAAVINEHSKEPW